MSSYVWYPCPRSVHPQGEGGIDSWFTHVVIIESLYCYFPSLEGRGLRGGCICFSPPPQSSALASSIAVPDAILPPPSLESSPVKGEGVINCGLIQVIGD